MIHGNPSPRNTLTEFDPVTLPTAESALSDYCAAVILANKSGRDVPRATKVIAVTDFGIPTKHPNIAATSPTTTTMRPMKVKATQNAGYPPPQLTGGTHANNTFQVIVTKCITPSLKVTLSTIILSSSI
jgi:hypothetical protein